MKRLFAIIIVLCTAAWVRAAEPTTYPSPSISLSPATLPSSAESVSPPAILVAPFLMIGEGHPWMGQAIQEDLAATVSKRAHLPTKAYAKSLDPTDVTSIVQAGKESGAMAVITGTIQVLGDQVRISGQEIDVASGRIVGVISASGTGQQLFTMEDSLDEQLAPLLPQPANPPLADASGPQGQMPQVQGQTPQAQGQIPQAQGSQAQDQPAQSATQPAASAQPPYVQYYDAPQVLAYVPPPTVYTYDNYYYPPSYVSPYPYYYPDNFYFGIPIIIGSHQDFDHRHDHDFDHNHGVGINGSNSGQGFRPPGVSGGAASPMNPPQRFNPPRANGSPLNFGAPRAFGSPRPSISAPRSYNAPSPPRSSSPPQSSGSRGGGFSGGGGTHGGGGHR